MCGRTGRSAHRDENVLSIRQGSGLPDHGIPRDLSHRQEATRGLCVREQQQLGFVDVLPGASVVEIHGEFNEDWLRTLRVRRVLTADDTVLVDVEDGHDDRQFEEAIDNVNTEYLDLLLDLTGDAYMGASTIRLG